MYTSRLAQQRDRPLPALPTSSGSSPTPPTAASPVVRRSGHRAPGELIPTHSVPRPAAGLWHSSSRDGALRWILSVAGEAQRQHVYRPHRYPVSGIFPAYIHMCGGTVRVDISECKRQYGIAAMACPLGGGRGHLVGLLLELYRTGEGEKKEGRCSSLPSSGSQSQTAGRSAGREEGRMGGGGSVGKVPTFSGMQLCVPPPPSVIIHETNTWAKRCCESLVGWWKWIHPYCHVTQPKNSRSWNGSSCFNFYVS